MWLLPNRQGLPPNYGSMRGAVEQRQNKWFHMVSAVNNDEVETPVKINTDANMYVAEIQKGGGRELPIQAGRMAYVLCISGQVGVTGAHGTSEQLEQHDAAQLPGPNKELRFAAQTDAHVLVVEMGAAGRGGIFGR